MKLSDGIKDYILECNVRNFTHATIDVKKGVLERFTKVVGDLPIDKVTRVVVKRYIVNCKETCKASSINTQLQHLSAMFRFLVQEELIEANPCEGITPLKEERQVIRTYKPELVLRLITGMDGVDFQSVRNKTIITLLVETGIRCSELCNIHLEDIFDNSIQIMGKGKKVRYVPLTKSLDKQVKLFLRIREGYLKGTSNFLFTNRCHNQLTRFNVLDVVKKVLGDTDVATTVHNFRRFYAQQMLDNVDLYTVSRLLGHSDIKTTERYIRGIEDKKILEKGMMSPLSNIA